MPPTPKEDLKLKVSQGYLKDKINSFGIPVRSAPWAPLEESRRHVSRCMFRIRQARRYISAQNNSGEGERAWGRRLVEEKYTWDAVVKGMLIGYEEV